MLKCIATDKLGYPNCELNKSDKCFIVKFYSKLNHELIKVKKKTVNIYRAEKQTIEIIWHLFNQTVPQCDTAGDCEERSNRQRK